MKKLVFLLSFLTAFVFISNSAQSQFTVSGSTGADGSYTSLTNAGGAFLAINSNVQTGNNIVISVTSDALAETGANSLNAGAWTSLFLSPTGGAVRVVSGSFTGALINLNGADNVTVDGLNTGGNGLTIANTAKGGSSTIRFIADASNNVITNCNVQGSDSLTSNGVIFFSTGTSTGNDGNTISNCNISSAGANLPLNGIFSSGTSAAIDNSGNTVSGNNISDYFGAALASNGVFVSTGNSLWTITNNKFFQTANRIYTTSNTHNGISITSGGGYTITGNVIGYANSSGTGTTNMVGMTTGALGGTFPSSYTSGGTANATRFIAINCSFTAGSAVSSIQNNTVAGFALYTSSGASTSNGILCGINVTGGNANIGTVTGNTIGSTSGNGSIYTVCTTSGGAVVGIYASSTGTVNILNNTVGAIDAMGNTASISGSVTGINTASSGTFNLSGNTIGNSVNPNLRMGNLTTAGNLSNTGTTFSATTGSAAFKGILNSVSGTNTIGTLSLPNIIRNANVNSSATSTTFRGIENTSSSGTTSVTNNSVSNITTVSANVTISSAGITGIGIHITGGALNTSVTQNNISALSLTNSTAIATNVAGITISGPNNLTVSKNIIYDLSNASTSVSVTAPGSISGVFVRNTAISSLTIVNNMITLGNAQTTNTCIVGIWGNHAQLNNPTVTNIYYNSVYITGTVTSGAQPSFGYLRGDLSSTARTVSVDIRNNIFNNDRTGGTGNHYAISNNYGATASSSGWGVNASNFNVLNSASSSTVGYWNSNQTLGAWRTASSSDQLSLTAIPVTFVNFASGDLHLNMGLTPTQLESGGIVIGSITTDIDGQTRPGPAGSVNGGATSPDFGADEFDGVPLDLTPPTISYNLLLGSSCYTTRDLTATIFDGLGLNVSPGLKPRVYYKKSTNLDVIPGTNDNTTDGWKYAEATNSVSPFNFTIDYSLTFGGATSGDVIQYFVVAQDTALVPNVGINSGTFAVTPSSVALVASNLPMSGLINSYTLLNGLSGIVTIGASGTYTTLTDAAGLFAAINANGLNGNLVAEILDAGITENGLNALNSIQFGCSSAYSLTIRPATGVTTLISGSNPTALLDLNGAGNVTIDGSNNGSSSKDMTIRNTGTGASIRFINGALYDTVRSCIIESQNSSLTGGTIFFSTSAGTSGNSNIVISGCNVRDRSDAAGIPANSIYSNGTVSLPNANNKISGCNVFNFTNSGVLVAAAGAGDGWVINPSSFYQTVASTTVLRFISILGGNGHSIINNFIGGTAPNAGGSFLPTTADFSGIELSVGSVTATSVQGNTVMNIRCSAGSGFGSYGININTGLVNVGNITGNNIGSADTSKHLGMPVGGSFGIVSRSSNFVNISNNIINSVYMLFEVESSGIGGIYLEATTSGSCSVINNTITNLISRSRGGSPLLGGSANMNGLTVFVKGICTVRGNTISNIGNTYTLPGLSPSNITGMYILQTLPGSIFENNIISGLYGSNTVSGTNAEGITGINTSQAVSGTFLNNVVSLNGSTFASDKKVTGIYEGSGTSGSVNYYNNSVNIYGTSSGTNNTYAFLRPSFFQTPVYLRNNVFSNSRVAATGFNLAIANEVTSPNSANGWNSSASNYNALYSLNSAAVTRWGATNYDLAGWQNQSGGDSYTLAGDPGFTSNTNLLPAASNINNWILKGNGIALASVSSDISGTPRSTSIATGGTDIGAYEFSTTVQPPIYTNPTPSSGIYKFIHKLDTMATVNVTAIGTLADINVQYYSGEDPPGLAGDPTVTDGYGNVYWEIHPSNPANSGYTYNVTLHYSPALIGTITNESNIKVAKNTDADTLYAPFTVIGTGPGEYQIDTVKNNITVFGLTAFSRFILTDGNTVLPVELSSFTSDVERRDVNLNWTTSSEINNSGFDIERSTDNSNWSKAGNVNGSGNSNSPKNYKFTDRNLASGNYNYRLKQIDFNGEYTYFNLNNEVNIGVPVKFDLSQNYPNPFNPATKINFDIPADGKVSIILYDITGKEVSKLVNEIKTAGYYTISFNASNLASGIYFYRINAEGNGQNFISTKKMMVVK